ncbi:MAG: helix-turn-helix transcriptional regulator [Cyanobacteria bacterium P01_H01_bin.15]
MDLSLSFDNIQRAAKDFQRRYGGNFELASQETILLMPATFGQGYLRGINLRPGLDLFIYQYDLKDNLVLDFQKLSLEHSFVNLTFCLSGRCSGSMPELRQDLNISAWQTALATVPYASGTVELFKGQQITVIEIVASPAFILSLIETRLRSMPTDWKEVLHAAASRPYYHVSSTPLEITKILQLILNCPYQGTLRQFYLEAKSLELVCLYFSGLMDSLDEPSHCLKPQEIESLHEARSVLLRNMDAPPTMADLAKQVMLSERKLQQGFQALFGTTVFGLLHDSRMERARQLLEADTMTIGAIAHTVGIVHRGYFATAFKRKFGSTPRQYLKQYSKRH